MSATRCSKGTSRRAPPERKPRYDKARANRGLYFFMAFELLLVVIVKALAELAFMFMLGRGILYVLAGRKREGNIFYGVLRVVTDPVIRAARFVTPRLVVDAHIPFVAVLLLVWIWLAIVFWVLPAMCNSGYDCSALLERKQ